MKLEGMENKLSRLEEELRKVPGIRNARVVGDGEPSEIHIVAGSGRSPKQLVRDVQSLSAAGFGMPIDHRIVSIVRIEDSAPPPAPSTSAPDTTERPAPPGRGEESIEGKPDVTGGEVPQPTSSASPSPAAAVGRTQDAGAAQAGAETTHAPQAAARAAAEQAPATQAEDQDLSVNGRRPVVDRVVLASKGDSGWVKVGLRWPDGDVTEGAGTAGTSRESRARGATNALLSALEPVLQNMRAHIDIDQVVIHQLGSQDSVLVRAVFYDRGSPTPVVGSALVHDDVATAAVRALLQAVNRKLLTSHD